MGDPAVVVSERFDMCGRITVLTLDEVREAVRSIESRRGMRLGGRDDRAHARPGSQLHLIDLRDGKLGIAQATWGIEAPWSNRLAYNTRLESALGGSAMWAKPIREGRCILPAATFFEPHATETAPSPKTGRPIKRPYEFAMDDGAPLLLASVCDGERLSVVTTEPNEHVSPVHPRMPLALRFDEVPLWLEGDLADIASLADRSTLALRVQPENLGAAPAPRASRTLGGADDSQLTLF